MESLDLSEDGPGNNFSKIFSLKTTHEPEKFSMFKFLNNAKQQGLLKEYECGMIENLLNLKNVSVYNIITHRINIKAVEKNTKPEDVIKIFAETGFSKIPVYEEDVDSIIGVVHAKELLKLKINGGLEEKSINKYIKKTVYIPESMKCEAALNQLIKENQDLAVVVDEYGGTSGIITLKDVKDFVFNGIGK